MNVIPSGWRHATLGDIAEYLNGAAFKPTDWGTTGRPIIRIQNLTDLDKPLNRTTRIVPERLLVRNGDILVSWSATLDTFIWNRGEAWLNQHIFKVIPNTNLVEKPFLFFVLKNEIARLIETEHLHGSTMRHINRGPFLSHQIGLPPRREQRRIVAKLDSLTGRTARAREQLRRIPNLIQKYREALTVAALSGSLTKDTKQNAWTDCYARDLLTWSSGKFLPKSKQANGEIPIYGGNGITGTHDRALIAFPTIVIGRVGAQCGNVHLTKGPAWITDNAIYAETISNRLDPRFALLVLRHAKLNARSGGTGQPYVNQDVLNEVEFQLPAITEQRDIIQRIETAFAWLDRVEVEHANASRLLPRLDQAILTKAFRGELVRQDPNEQPVEIHATTTAGSPARRGRPARVSN